MDCLVHWAERPPDFGVLQSIVCEGALECPLFCLEADNRWALHFLASEAQLWPDYRAGRFCERRPTFAEIRPVIEAAFELFEKIDEAGWIVGDLDDESLLVEQKGGRPCLRLLLTRPLPSLSDPTALTSMETRALDAPEFRNGEVERWSAASDVYLVAAWLVGILTGVSCFEDFTEMDYLAHQLRALSPDVPFTLHPWFAKSSALDPTERYRSIGEQRFGIPKALRIC